MEAQFKMGGNSIGNKFWTWLRDLSQNKVNKYTEKTVNVSNILFPTANTMIIKYELINLNQKYEIVIQGDYQAAFRHMKETGVHPGDINIESIIIDNHKRARLVSLPSNK